MGKWSHAGRKLAEALIEVDRRAGELDHRKSAFGGRGLEGRVGHNRFEVDRRPGELAKVGARASEPWDVGKGLLHRLGRVQELAVAAKTAGDLQAKGHRVLVDTARNGNCRVGDERDHIGQSEPVIIVTQSGAFELLEIELRPREWRYRHGRRQYQVIVAETRLEAPENLRLLGVGPGHVRESHAGCHFVIDADIGAERVRVFGVGIAIAVDVALGADDIETKICLAEIEFDFVTYAEKLPHGCDPTAEDTPYLSTHRALSKIFRESYAQPTEIDRPRCRDRSGIEREGQRLAVVHSDLGRE